MMIIWNNLKTLKQIKENLLGIVFLVIFTVGTEYDFVYWIKYSLNWTQQSHYFVMTKYRNER